MHGPEPAQSHELGKAAGILAVGFDRHGLESIADMPGLQQLHCKPCRCQASIEPLREWTGFQADPDDRSPCAANQAISACGSLPTLASLMILP